MDSTTLPDHTAHGYFIYGLRCPETGQILYVGKTWNPKARVASLVAGANAKLEWLVHRWIADLAAKGKRPRFEILCKLTGPLAQWLAPAAERRAIQVLSFRYPLLNVQHNLHQKRETRHADGRRMLTHQGKTQSLSAWAREIGLSRQGLHQRLEKYSVAVALMTPKQRKRQKQVA